MFARGLLLVIALALLQIVAGAPITPKWKKNIIFMVPDGLPPTAVNLARTYQVTKDTSLPEDYTLVFENYLIGTLKTHSASSLITDSAAAGTAFATGKKTYNGGIGVDADGVPQGTIMEALKELGYATGLVVTTQITDATPAVFGTHVSDRDLHGDIADQFVSPLVGDRTVDLMLGGGRCAFTPQSAEGSCRTNEVDVISQAQQRGWTYVGDRPGFDEAVSSGVDLPFMGLFSDRKMNYEIDRNATEQPSLAEMAKFALKTLEEKTKDSEQGFFILIESSRIDHTGHDNDPVALAQEVMAFNDAWQVAKDFVDNSDADTLIISSADHETGGVALGYDYQDSWYPETLLDKPHSSEHLVGLLTELNETSADNSTISTFINDYFVNELNVTDVKEEEIEKIIHELRLPAEDTYVVNAISKVNSDRAGIGYTTAGHSNAYVNLYGYSNAGYFEKVIRQTGQNKGLAGTHDNTEVPKLFAKLTGADLDAVTEKLANVQKE